MQSETMGEECRRWSVYGSLLGVWWPALQTVWWTHLHLPGKWPTTKFFDAHCCRMGTAI